MRRLLVLFFLVALGSPALAGTFVTGNTSLPALKTDAYAPQGLSSEIDSADVNNAYSDLGDLRAHTQGWVNAADYGVKCDGVTDDTPFLISAASLAVTNGTGVYIPCKVRVATSGTTTLAPQIVFGGGGSFDIRTGATLSLGEVHGGLHEIFYLNGGTLTLNRNKTRVGFPEWWGCVPGGADCLSALNSAVAALPVVQLQQADYYESSTLKITTPSVMLVGVPGIKSIGGTTGGTRLLITSGTLDTLQIGTDSVPGAINSFLQQVRVKDLEVSRTVALVSPGESYSGAAGVRIKGTLYTYLDHVWSTENQIGFALSATVQTHLTKCYAFRSVAAASGTDFFWGFAFDGNSSLVTGGLGAGGNASVYVVDANTSMGGSISSTGGTPITSKGFEVDNAFADLFFDNPETSAVQIGMIVSGSGANASSSIRQAGNADLHIHRAIIDGFTQYGILVTALSEHAAVDIEGSYTAPASGAAGTACYAVTASNASAQYGGSVSLRGNQCVAWPATGVRGIYVLNAGGVTSSGNMISGSTKPIELNTATNCSFRGDVIQNPSETAVQAAVLMAASTQNTIAPIAHGGATVFPLGINLASTGNTNNTIDPSGIPASTVTGGSGNKLVINAVQVTTTGLSGTNFITGVMN